MKKKKTLIALFAVLGGILIATGATYAWFSYGKAGTKQHTISSGSIKFHYSEDSQGITLNDALPMTDEQGIAGDYFEFSIDSKTSDTVDIPYYITARRSGTGTNMDNVVKVYLTKVVNNTETPLEIVTGKNIAKVSELGNYVNNDGINIPNTEHLLHTDKVLAGTSSYHEVYRLRMWIDSSANFIEQNTVYKCDGTVVEYNSTEYNACDPSNLTSEIEDTYPYNGKTYTLKVNVYGSAVEVNQSTVQLRANTDINDIGIDNNILTTSGESTTFEGTATMPAGETSMTKQITVNTENPNSTVTVEKLNGTTGAIVEEEVKRLSTNLTLNLGLGLNQFRITVRSEDGRETANYTLKITVSYPSYEVTMVGSNVTFGSNTVSVPYSGTNTVTVTPAENYYISNGSCSNGYTITGLITGSSATGVQTITINNNNNQQGSICTFTTAARIYVLKDKILQDNTLRTNTLNFSILEPTVSKYSANFNAAESTYNMSSNSSYYITYSDNYTFDSITGLYSLVNPQECQYSSCYNELKGKYIVSHLGYSDPGLGLASDKTNNIIKIHKVTTNTTQSDIHYISSTTVVDTYDSSLSGLYKMSVTNGFGGANGDTYYFRGKVENNKVKFANLDWKIIRINEDGTIRLILDGSTDENDHAYNTNTNNVNYMYYSNSQPKLDVEQWYNTNITGTNAQKVASGNYFCEAARVKAESNSNFTSGNATMEVYSSYTPDLRCVTDGNNKGLINNSVGLITYDEVVLAGGYFYKGNSGFYLHKNYKWWTMSPAAVKYGYARAWDVAKDGDLFYDTVNGAARYRPVINLKASTTVTKDANGVYVVQ